MCLSRGLVVGLRLLLLAAGGAEVLVALLPATPEGGQPSSKTSKAGNMRVPG
jgi:hypothetical protein